MDFYYDFEFDTATNQYVLGKVAPGPRLLKNIFGDKVFATVDSVSIMDGSLVDLKGFVGLNNLKRLCLFDCDELSDIAIVGEFPKLKYLSLSFCDKIQAVDDIKSLPHLEMLDVNYCRKLRSLSVLDSMTPIKTLGVSNCDSLENREYWQRKYGPWNPNLKTN